MFYIVERDEKMIINGEEVRIWKVPPRSIGRFYLRKYSAGETEENHDMLAYRPMFEQGTSRVQVSNITTAPLTRFSLRFIPYVAAMRDGITESVQRLGYGQDNWGTRVRFLVGQGIFLSSTASRPGSEVQMVSYSTGIAALSSGANRPGRFLTGLCLHFHSSIQHGVIHPEERPLYILLLLAAVGWVFYWLLINYSSRFKAS
jgi:hypothetical protein